MESILIKPKDKAELRLITEILQKMNISAEILQDIHMPNELTVKTIEDARKGEGLSAPIKNIKDFIGSL